MALRCRQQPDVIASDVIAIALVPNIHVSLRSDLQGYIVRPIHNEHTSHDKYIVSFGERTYAKDFATHIYSSLLYIGADENTAWYFCLLEFLRKVRRS